MAAEEQNDTLSSADHEIVDSVDKTLADALDLKKWWDATDRPYDERFELSATFNRPDTSFGFFGEAPVAGKSMDVMGNVQEQFFDRPKTPVSRRAGGSKSADWQKKHALWMRDQMREFVLRYFMRISDFRQPQAFPEDEKEKPPAYLRPLSWCPTDSAERKGFGFEQAYYKKRDGEIGKFSEDDKYAVIDLRELVDEYQWIVVKVNIFDFKFNLAPLGSDAPYGTVPLSEASYLVLSPDFIVNEDDPDPDTLGRYGFGYGFLPDPEESILAYGPGSFDAGFQFIHFHVRKSGEVFSRMAFVANRPNKIVNVSIDPFEWGMRMADFMSFGVASEVIEPMQKAWKKVPRPGGMDLVSTYISLANALSGDAAKNELCISKKQLEKTFLVQHFTQHYNVVAGSLVSWRQIPDWLDRDALPDWVKSGISS
ncbi:MAG: hypothetical protein GY856_17055 [bacterium]|nr:hypothetical protein [bacterium]